MLIDTHSHIYSEEFDDDRNEVIAHAEEVGVKLILLPAIDNESYDRQEQLAASRPDLFRQMMGLHPTSVDNNYKSNLELVHEKLFSQPHKYVGVGEIGLDLYWDTTFKEQQCKVLEQQILWAESLDKPIVLHVRNAYQEVFELLRRHGSIHYRGIMHCFSGTPDDAQTAIEMGFLLGIGGVVTYKKSILPEIVRTVGLKHIVLETDSPYLAPMPYRGHRNESSYVTIVAQKIAEILNISPQEVAELTTANTKQLFGI
ncbi:MAG: TatD family hydrolase [Bacteroidales bacterium]|nr:TatD family hydrolase [Bacteroidales bacterium]